MTYGKNNVDWQQRVDFKRLREDRIVKAHRMLHKYGIGAAIVFNWDSSRYLSAPWNHAYGKTRPSTFILLVRDAGFPYVPVRKGFDDEVVINDCPWLEGRVATEDVLYQPQVMKFRSEEDTVKAWTKTAQQIKSLMKEHGVAALPCSVDYANPLMIKTLQDAGLKIVDGIAWMLETDMVKTDDEVVLIEMAATCNEAGYAALMREFRPGMRENDAQAIMAKAIYEAGAEYIDGWVVDSGPRTSPRHFNWSDRVVRPGELMTAEAVAVAYCGYKVCYDRTFLVGGKPTDLQKEIYQITTELVHKVEELLKPGNTTHDVARARPWPAKGYKSLEEIRKGRSELKGTGFTNHMGGMGIRYDAAPTCTLEFPDLPLEKNMVISYHCVFWVEGGEGAAIENTYRITENGCKNLHKWPFEELMVLGN